MIILISPAKKMKSHIDYMEAKSIPYFYKEAEELNEVLKKYDVNQLMKILKCSSNIAEKSAQEYQKFNISEKRNPALLTYDGIQYSYMAPHVFDDDAFLYVEKHLRILSAFYGVLKIFDGILPYRLEMEHILDDKKIKRLYDYWGDKIYHHVVSEDNEILDLSSSEYGKSIYPYVESSVNYKKCRFYEYHKDKLVEKGVYVKMARGAMVRYLAHIKAESFEDVKGFKEMGYCYCDELSNDDEIVFVRKKEQ